MSNANNNSKSSTSGRIRVHSTPERVQRLREQVLHVQKHDLGFTLREAVEIGVDLAIELLAEKYGEPDFSDEKIVFKPGRRLRR